MAAQPAGMAPKNGSKIKWMTVSLHPGETFSKNPLAVFGVSP
jgi:hypothetical protein